MCSLDPEAGVSNFFEKERLFSYKRISIFDNRGEDILAHMETAYSFIEQVSVASIPAAPSDLV